MNIQKPYIKKAVEELGFKAFTEVQNKVIPVAIKGEDIIGCSQTGSGKTHAFLIPIFENLDVSSDDVEVVITSPTRELANQIYTFAKQIANHSETLIDIRRYTGGSNRQKELERLEKSQPQIVIGTPGKLRDLAIKENKLKIYSAKTFVVDEADMAMDSGFLEDIDQIASVMKEDLQMMVFSATIPEKLKPFLRKYMTNPFEVYVKPQELSSLNIEHVFVPLKSKQRKTMIDKLLQVLNPYVAIIFCNTKETVEELGSHIISQGYNAAKLHGGIPARERNRIMKMANNGDFQYIIASDIASRGIDIDGVSHVINYELPRDMEFYVHRTGRTGRASYDGLAISFYGPNDDAYVDFLEQKGIDIAYKDIKDGELVHRRERKERDKRERVTAGFDKHTLNVKKNNKKVKPGYKKKYHKKVQEAKKRVLRKKRRS
ncbi:DEAD/DEAH box helicase [Candidatus Xianfuyuplasma coldseepsis]|uniref:DEAD/DEAH box helicase n=1 Tax=Candidatus Xianfuyuplasma coldseepsis TaxID=2782163 RepID=A0A7L7KSH7_9MOLU|nr:DEAD/DEAH box helicase [Xianfuyuplasma coldseepsis]QMS85693.1 DEAD/DEAH box helicase [Xianfuyuplasma coldseepsis]